MSVQKIYNIIKKARPLITESSLNQYVNNVKQIWQGISIEAFDEMDDTVLTVQNVFGFLSSKNIQPNTAVGKLNSIIVYILAKEGKESPRTEAFSTARNALHKSYEERVNNGGKSTSENEKWASRAELEKIRKFYRKSMLLYKLEPTNVDKITKKQILDIEHAFIWSYYLSWLDGFDQTNHGVPPVRLEIGSMVLSTYKNYKKLKNPTNNYLLYNGDKFGVRLHDFKTSRSHGLISFEILHAETVKLLKLLVAYRLYHNQERLLPGFTQNSLSKFLSYSSFKIIKKRISSQMLRKIFISLEFGEQNEKSKDAARIMGHSQSTQRDVYIRK